MTIIVFLSVRLGCAIYMEWPPGMICQIKANEIRLHIITSITGSSFESNYFVLFILMLVINHDLLPKYFQKSCVQTLPYGGRGVARPFSLGGGRGYWWKKHCTIFPTMVRFSLPWYDFADDGTILPTMVRFCRRRRHPPPPLTDGPGRYSAGACAPHSYADTGTSTGRLWTAYAPSMQEQDTVCINRGWQTALPVTVASKIRQLFITSWMTATWGVLLGVSIMSWTAQPMQPLPGYHLLILLCRCVLHTKEYWDNIWDCCLFPCKMSLQISSN